MHVEAEPNVVKLKNISTKEINVTDFVLSAEALRNKKIIKLYNDCFVIYVIFLLSIFLIFAKNLLHNINFTQKTTQERYMDYILPLQRPVAEPQPLERLSLSEAASSIFKPLLKATVRTSVTSLAISILSHPFEPSYIAHHTAFLASNLTLGIGMNLMVHGLMISRYFIPQLRNDGGDVAQIHKKAAIGTMAFSTIITLFAFAKMQNCEMPSEIETALCQKITEPLRNPIVSLFKFTPAISGLALANLSNNLTGKKKVFAFSTTVVACSLITRFGNHLFPYALD